MNDTNTAADGAAASHASEQQRSDQQASDQQAGGHTVRRTMYPAMRYADAHGAIDWLEQAFGFRRHAVYQTDDGAVGHAELLLGDGMVMLGQDRDDTLPLRAPGNAEKTAMSVYVYVDDVDAHYARARAAGADVVRELADTPYGSREYSARDLEGHLWSFGTYRP